MRRRREDTKHAANQKISTKDVKLYLYERNESSDSQDSDYSTNNDSDNEQSAVHGKRKRGVSCNDDGNSEIKNATANNHFDGSEHICSSCGKPEGDDFSSTLLTCDDCSKQIHVRCVTPSLPPTFMPPSKKQSRYKTRDSDDDLEWFCVECVLSFGSEFMFDSGKTYTLGKFNKHADEFKHRHFAKQGKIWSPNSTTDVAMSSLLRESSLWASEPVVEKEYWRLVQDSFGKDVDVEYGADISANDQGSFFPTKSNFHTAIHANDRMLDIGWTTHKLKASELADYAKHPWNLNVLPYSKGSLFRFIREQKLSGVMVPWVYVGMCFSTFSWHNEDHYTPSVNYHHFGETKVNFNLEML